MINCAIIKDLLPLYADNVLSKESNALVCEHLATCANCKNELASMRSEVTKSRMNDEDAKIKVMKSVKRKIFMQKVSAAIAACLLVIVFAFVGIYFVFHHSMPIVYEQGRVWVEMRTVKVRNYPGSYAGSHMSIFGVFGRVNDYEAGSYDNSITQTANVLDFTSSRDFSGISTHSRELDINGVYTAVILIAANQTLATRWWPDHDRNWSFRLAAAYENDVSPLPIEVFYVATLPNRARYLWAMSDEDFFAQRENGILLWRGTLESPK